MNLKLGHRGVAIIMAMITLAVISIIAAAYLLMVSREHRMTYKSFRALQAINLAEAGIERAIYWFNNPSDYSPPSAFEVPRGAAMEVTQTSLTDDSKSWTTNEFAGKYLVMTNGNAEDNIYSITSNTNDTLTCSGATLTDDGVGVGDSYFISRFIGTAASPDINVPDGQIPDLGSTGEIDNIIVFAPPATTQVATVRSTATAGGTTKTVEVVVEVEEAFPVIPSAIVTDQASEWSGSAGIHWGKVQAGGDIKLLDPMTKLPDDLIVPQAWDPTKNPIWDPWFRCSAGGILRDNNGTPVGGADQPWATTSPAPGPYTYDYEYYQNQSNPPPPDLNYSELKEYAKSLGTYYYPDSTASGANLLDKGGNDSGYDANQFNGLVQYVEQTKGEHFVFVDFVNQVENGTLGNLGSSGTLYAEVSAYIGGSLSMSGSGSGQSKQLTTPGGGTYTTDVNIMGWLYTAGTFNSTGNPAIYGALVTKGGFVAGGTPSVYYNSQLAKGSAPPGLSKVKLVSWEEK